MSAVDAPTAAWPAVRPATAARRLAWWPAVGLVLAAALGLRLWGVTHGLPYAYNADENADFVPGAIGLFGHSWNPHYFVNPPAYTYLLHVIFAAWFGGGDGVASAYTTDPSSVFLVARATAAIVGTIAVGLTYLAGARLFGRGPGLLAAALLGVAFLPVFYGHLALNDAPTLAPIALSLWGTAGVLRRGRTVDFVIAGAGLGLACATKYTGGVVLVPLLAAGLLGPRRSSTAAVRGLVIAGAVAVAVFLAANPYAVLDVAAFREGLGHQRDASDAALGKLGLTETSGWAYYAWTLTWGLGWAPLGAAIAGLVVAAGRDRRLLAVLGPAVLLFLLFMGSQARFFGRWLIPILPILCLLAAYAVSELVLWLRARRGGTVLAPLAGAIAAAALCAQGLLHTVHGDRVLSRADTRNVTRDWMVAHVPARSRIVVEPGVVPDGWASDVGRAYPGAQDGRRWIKYATSRSKIANDGSVLPGRGRVVNIEDYERTLRPWLIDRYERGGFCWVVTGSTQRGRADAQPSVVPGAIAYYRELERRADVVYEASPYDRGAAPVAFNFDWSFDFYPLAYERPGPLMRVYRLRGGACARVS
jgi:4-amino-4-deoxy-L-arabinose transferase-like glycosyltransferase